MFGKKFILPLIIGCVLITAFILGISSKFYSVKEVNLPILMYHHINETGDASVTISAELFEAHMLYITDSGYTPVSFGEIIAFVENGTPLPEKPVCIVFDDGYQSNYTISFPILQKLKIKAAICIIGSSVGKSTYKDTEFPIIPHFGWDEMRVMVESGLVSIQNYTYDMHMYPSYETGTVRKNVLRLEGEEETDYISVLTYDYTKNVRQIKENLGYEPQVFAYPSGAYDELSERIIRSLGAKITLSTDVGLNIIREFDRETLFLMKRYSINQTTDIETLQSYLDGVIPNQLHTENK